jgi:bifunctional DNA-binding transcriptional regulator/antitoxin component of YhaV-PrlF toxin-antitoxin module
LEEVSPVVTLMRVFARVDKDGKVTIPDNIRRATGLQPGQLVEVKALAKKSVVISARGSAR